LSRILGVSGLYHDAAACLLVDGEIAAAAQEERFTRRRHDASLPRCAIRYCLAAGGLRPGDRLDALAFYEKPLKKLHRILETSLAAAPAGLSRFLHAMPPWLREKLWIEPTLQAIVREAGFVPPDRCFFPEHHESHAASAFFPSPFEDAAVLTVDGVGEWATASVGQGRGNRLELLWELDFPHSLGLLYSAFTAFCGFRIHSGEHKLMGLAPYGEGRYTQRILDELLDLKADGSFALDMRHFGFLSGDAPVRASFERLFDGPARQPEADLTIREADLARSIQEVTEEILLRMARHVRRVTGQSDLCLAGGVALNCVANGRLLRSGIFDRLWIQPAAGDAGGAIGAAYAVWHTILEEPRHSGADRMRGALLGPQFSRDEIVCFLDRVGAVYEEPEEAAWADAAARAIADGAVVGLFQGRMELGPRALGNRSIVADPRSPAAAERLSRHTKRRERFRPFAPAVREDRAARYFELDRPSPYMLLTVPVCAERRLDVGDERRLSIEERAGLARSDIPAVTHVDGSARVQTVAEAENPRFWALLGAFERLSGCGVLLNTSFNVRGEPIVCTPEDAWRCFMSTDIDVLAIGPFFLRRSRQTASGPPPPAFEPD
jgi:carbamoyltransferase